METSRDQNKALVEFLVTKEDDLLPTGLRRIEAYRLAAQEVGVDGYKLFTAKELRKILLEQEDVFECIAKNCKEGLVADIVLKDLPAEEIATVCHFCGAQYCNQYENINDAKKIAGCIDASILADLFHEYKTDEKYTYRGVEFIIKNKGIILENRIDFKKHLQDKKLLISIVNGKLLVKMDKEKDFDWYKSLFEEMSEMKKKNPESKPVQEHKKEFFEEIKKYFPTHGFIRTPKGWERDGRFVVIKIIQGECNLWVRKLDGEEITVKKGVPSRAFCCFFYRDFCDEHGDNCDWQEMFACIEEYLKKAKENLSK